MVRRIHPAPKSSTRPTLDLSDVTLCAADTLHPALAACALTRSMEQCRFGDAILFSDAVLPGPFRPVRIAPLGSRDDYSVFTTREMVRSIQTAFVLVVQWDGYVVDATAWSDTFREYDYIGARWPGHTDGLTVGNGGFSLRSRKLLEVLVSAGLSCPPGETEDEFICRRHRRTLEREHGLRFAPEHVADQFAYERAPRLQTSFGFHGLFNLWHHLSPAEMVATVGMMSASTIRTSDFAETMMIQLGLQSTRVARAMYLRWCQEWPAAERLPIMRSWLDDPAAAMDLLQQFDRLIARSGAMRTG